MIVEHAHYTALLIWVIGNLVWAGGEIYDPKHDTPFPFLNPPNEAYITLRWYSSWILATAFTTIFAMYLIWIQSTELNRHNQFVSGVYIEIADNKDVTDVISDTTIIPPPPPSLSSILVNSHSNIDDSII